MKKNLLLLTFLILGLTIYSQPNLKWAFSISDSSAIILHEVIHDDLNNIYVLADFYGDSIDIDPSISNHFVTQSTAWSSMFLAKYSNTGNFIWGFSIDSCNGTSMIINNNKLLLLAGGNGDVDPSTNVVTVNEDFIAQYNLNGTFNWMKPVFNYSFHPSFTRSKSINHDVNNNIFITGWFNQKISFNGVDTLQSWLNGGGSDLFLAKYDSSGNNIWGTNIEKAENGEDFSSTCTDSSLNVYLVANHYQGLVDADPSSGSTFFNSTGTKTIISKFSANGVFLNATSFDVVSSNAISHNNGIIITGFIDKIIDFDPSANSVIVQGSPMNPLQFIASYDSSLNYRHLITPITTHGHAYHITPDENGNYHVVGRNGNLDSTGIVPGNGYAAYAQYNQNNNLNNSFSFGNSITPSTVNSLSNNDIIIGGQFNGINDLDPDTTQIFNITNTGFYDDIFIANYTYSIVPVGIKTPNDYQTKVSIFPNPTLSQLSIDTDQNIREVKIIDMTGKIIMITKENTNIINVTDLSTGIYFIRLITEERTITKKFVKQ